MQARPDLELVQAGTGTEPFEAALPRAEGIGIRVQNLPASILSRAPRLRIVAKHGVGTDAIDVAWCTAHGIPVTVTPDANTISVAEHTLALMLATAKQLRPYDTALRAGQWAVRDTLAAFELSGRTVLVVGAGRVGTRVAQLCRAFGMTVLVHARRPAPGSTGLDDGLAQADFVTLHLPRTPETTNLFDAARIARMKPGAILINTSRGGIVDETALAEALRTGRLAAAGLDVFSTEPCPAGIPLANLANVILTPHSAASTVDAAHRMAVSMARSLLLGLDGTLAPGDVMNPEALAAA